LKAARASLEAGDLDGAARTAQAIIDQWPTAARARLLLARIRRAQGKPEQADTLLRWVASHAAEPLAQAARRRLTGRRASVQWRVAGRVAIAHDSAVLPPAARDPSASADLRGELGARVGLSHRRGGAALNLMRSVHREAGFADATLARLDGGWHWGKRAHRLQWQGDARVVLADRAASPHHTVLGTGLTWWRLADWSPFAQVHGGWAAFQAAAERADTPHEARVRGATGMRWLGARHALVLRVDGRWHGPAEAFGFTDVGATLSGTVRWRALGIHGAGGWGARWTDLGREIRPRARFGLTLAATHWLHLDATMRWQAAYRDPETVDRLVTGIGVEIRR
jgi:hypothetical protein